VSFFRNKTARTALWYVLMCAALLAVARAQRLALCADWRFAALRELQRSGEDAEVIFLGSSRTARGLVPASFEAQLDSLGGSKAGALNLAVMGQPRHVNYLQLLSYLRDHAAPKMLCVEVGDVDFDDRDHPTLTRFMTPFDALRAIWYRPYRTRGELALDDPEADPGSWLDALLRLVARQALHVELALDALGRGPEDVVRTGYNMLCNGFTKGSWLNPYWAEEPPIAMETLRDQLERKGWYLITPEARDAIEGPERVLKKAADVSIERALEQRSRKNLFAPRKYRFTRIYTRKIADLCRAHGIRLVFMELPGFRQPTLSDSQVEFYQSLGELFRPDRQALYQVENYMDPGHLTSAGAELYTRELARFVAAQP
jgi:hypothetical protein